LTYLRVAISVHAEAISDVAVRTKKANGIFVEFYPLWKNKKIYC